MYFRQVRTLKKKIDSLVSKGIRITLCHGNGGYSYVSYGYEEGNYLNGFKESLRLFAESEGMVFEYMLLTDDDLRRPTADDWFKELVCASWEPEFPSLLHVTEYWFRRSEA